MSTPALSIVTVTFNNPEELDRTLSSIRSVQDYRALQAIEVVVVDGGTVNLSVERLEAHAAAVSLRYIRESDRGIYDAMNKGTGVARGQFLMFLNSGDVVAFRDLRRLLAELGKLGEKGDYIYGKTNIETDGRVRTIPEEARTLSSEDDHLSATICHQAMIFRAEDCRAIPYDTNLTVVGDYDLKYQLFKTGIGYFSDAFVVGFDGNGVSSKIDSIRLLKARIYETSLMYIRYRHSLRRYLRSLATHIAKFLRYKLIGR